MGAESVELTQGGVTPTGHICADCGEELTYNEEVWLIQVMQPQYFNGAVHFHQVIDENNVEGDFLFEPYFFCFSCWEKTYEALRHDVQDEPPVEDQAGVIECVCCGSSIREWEYAGVFELGELRVSRRSPNNQRGPHFESISNPDVMCLYCLVLLNDGYIEMWDELTQCGECTDCIQIRCWRESSCPSNCSCHTEATGDDE